MLGYTHHLERSVTIPATRSALFDRLDDPTLLGSHMSEGSIIMLGGSMRYSLDAAAGKAVGSVIGAEGRFLGFALLIREKVTEHVPPTRKVWETVGRQRLIVIDGYRMGFETRPSVEGTELRVFIDYRQPDGPFGRLLGRICAPFYARWCVTRMVEDAQRQFIGTGSRP